jgi:DNA-directed RNA polymerase specialized sigma24 family protein
VLVAAAADPTTHDAAQSVEESVLGAERNAAIRAAFVQQPPHCQQLLSQLVHHPPLTYAAIGARLGMPVGGLGPRPARCLQKLRRCPALAVLIKAEDGNREGGEKRDRPVVER